MDTFTETVLRVLRDNDLKVYQNMDDPSNYVAIWEQDRVPLPGNFVINVAISEERKDVEFTGVIDRVPEERRSQLALFLMDPRERHLHAEFSFNAKGELCAEAVAVLFPDSGDWEIVIENELGYFMNAVEGLLPRLFDICGLNAQERLSKNQQRVIRWLKAAERLRSK